MTWTTLNRIQLVELPAESQSVITISTFFHPEKTPVPPANFRLTQDSVALLNDSIRALSFGGLLFVYGTPHDLAYYGEHLSNFEDEKIKMLFKYWITLAIDDAPRADGLKPESMGLLMYLKSHKGKASPTPFELNTNAVRFAHNYCTACKENTKDWGGKKHLMNPAGTALSDVWRDLPRARVADQSVPLAVLDRIYALTAQDRATHVHIMQKVQGVESAHAPVEPVLLNDEGQWENLAGVQPDEVYQGDCISFLKRVSALHPDGLFDLCFADPPYNLEKSYNSYHDAMTDHRYLNWCSQWIEGMVQTLRPGGSLFILNLPKWALHHTAYLNRRLEFRNWITWDALSDPRGKIMPAHYSLLYYVKPGGNPVFNYGLADGSVKMPDSPQYCLRDSCIKRRKKTGDDAKVELSDIWFDVHRIKHKKDRDAHPCQLPEKLMERIIMLASRPGDLVFDPFGGAGTTAIAAKKLGRHFIVTELDERYAEIIRRNIQAMDAHAELYGELRVPRQSVKRQKGPAAKKQIELYLQKLALELGREPAESEIDAEVLKQIDAIYPDRLTAIKRCRVVLRSQPPLLQTSL